MSKHDKVDPYGFDVPVEQLAHDLAIAKLANDETLKHDADGYEPSGSGSEVWTDLDTKYFKRYKQWNKHFLGYLDDQTRYDSTFKN